MGEWCQDYFVSKEMGMNIIYQRGGENNGALKERQLWHIKRYKS
jgi:hypothetical protein